MEENKIHVYDIKYQNSCELIGTNCKRDIHSIKGKEGYYDQLIGLILFSTDKNESCYINCKADDIKFGSDIILDKKYIFPVRRQGVWYGEKLLESRHDYGVYYSFLEKAFNENRLFIESRKIVEERDQLTMF